MAIRTTVTRGFGNGVFNGSITMAAARGYFTGVAIYANIRNIVTRGFSNGVFNGTITNIATRGYATGVDVYNLVIRTAYFTRTTNRDTEF